MESGVTFEQFIFLIAWHMAVVFVVFSVGTRAGVAELADKVREDGYFCHKGTRFHVMLIDGETPVEKSDRLDRIEERIAMLRRFANTMRGIP